MATHTSRRLATAVGRIIALGPAPFRDRYQLEIVETQVEIEIVGILGAQALENRAWELLYSLDSCRTSAIAPSTSAPATVPHCQSPYFCEA